MAARISPDWSKIAPIISRIAADPSRYIELRMRHPENVMTLDLLLVGSEADDIFRSGLPDIFEGEVISDDRSLPSGAAQITDGSTEQ